MECTKDRDSQICIGPTTFQHFVVIMMKGSDGDNITFKQTLSDQFSLGTNPCPATTTKAILCQTLPMSPHPSVPNYAASLLH